MNLTSSARRFRLLTATAVLILSTVVGFAAPQAASATTGPSWSTDTRIALQTYSSPTYCVAASSNKATVQVPCEPFYTKANLGLQESWYVNRSIVVNGQRAYQFSNGNSLCLGVNGQSKASGTDIGGHLCYGTTDHYQFWIPIAAFSDGIYQYTFINVASGLYLGANSMNDGSPVRQYNLSKAPHTFGLIFGGKYVG